MSRPPKSNSSGPKIVASRFAVLEEDDGGDLEPESPTGGLRAGSGEEEEIRRAIALVEEFERRERAGNAGTSSGPRKRSEKANRLQGRGAKAVGSPRSGVAVSKSNEQVTNERNLMDKGPSIDELIVRILEILPDADLVAVQAALLEHDMDLSGALEALTLGNSSIGSDRGSSSSVQQIPGSFPSDPDEDDEFRLALRLSRESADSDAQHTSASQPLTLEVFVADDDIQEDDGRSLEQDETGLDDSWTDPEDSAWEQELERIPFENSPLEFLVDVIPEVPRSLLQELCAKYPDVDGPELFDWLVALRDHAAQAYARTLTTREAVESGLCNFECRRRKGGEKACILHGADNLLRKLKKREQQAAGQDAVIGAFRSGDRQTRNAWQGDAVAAVTDPANATGDLLDGFTPVRLGRKKVVLVPRGNAGMQARTHAEDTGLASKARFSSSSWSGNDSVWQTYREKALEAHERARQLYLRANQAQARKDLTGKGTAAYYAELAREARAEMQQWNDQAASELMGRSGRSNVLDLHHMFLKEAVAAVEERLTEFYRGWTYNKARADRRQFKIVTGRGLHSNNQVARIHPAICGYLRRRGWRFQARAGNIIVLGPGE